MGGARGPLRVASCGRGARGAGESGRGASRDGKQGRRQKHVMARARAADERERKRRHADEPGRPPGAAATRRPPPPWPRPSGVRSHLILAEGTIVVRKLVSTTYSVLTVVTGLTVGIDHVRTSDSLKMVTVSSIEELDTRSMHMQTPLGSLPATGGSHVQRAILSQAPTMKRHISSRGRIGLRSGERVGIGTVSTTVARSFNSNARSSSQVKVLVDHQVASLANAFARSCGRMYLLRSGASSVLLRTKTGPWRRHVRRVPSNPHVRATSRRGPQAVHAQKSALGPSRGCIFM